MIVDSSVFVAVVLNEPRRVEFLRELTAAPVLKMSAVTMGETLIVLFSRGGQIKVDMFHAFVESLKIEVVGVDRMQAEIAFEAFRQYGKGRHPAKLNIADCFTYALAKYHAEPLLFQGNDFSQTDVLKA
jgi:ribonuclease VapC